MIPIQQPWGWVCKIWAFRDTPVTLSAWSRSYTWRNTGTDDSACQLGAIGLVHRAGRGEDGVSWLGHVELEEGLSCTWLEGLLAFREQTEALEPPSPHLLKCPLHVRISHFLLRQIAYYTNQLISQASSKSLSHKMTFWLSIAHENYTPMRMNAMAITKVRRYPLRGSLFFP